MQFIKMLKEKQMSFQIEWLVEIKIKAQIYSLLYEEEIRLDLNQGIWD